MPPPPPSGRGWQTAPMSKPAVALTFLLVVSGCGGSSNTATPATTVAPAATRPPTTTVVPTTTAAPTTTAVVATTTMAPTTTTAAPVIVPNDCDAWFPDAVEVDSRQFLLVLEDAINNVENRDTYSYIAPNGSMARNGPFGTWKQEAFESHLGRFRPAPFDAVRIDPHDILWENYMSWRETVCGAISGEGTISDSMVAYSRFMRHRTDWLGNAVHWTVFPYVETGSAVIAAPSPTGLEYYTKYITGGGVIIVGGPDVPDGAMLQARASVIYLTSARPEFREVLRDSHSRISLFVGESTAVLPEYRDTDESTGFAQGMTDASMTANADYMCYPGHVDVGGDPILHEMTHSLNHLVFEQINETYFYERVYALALESIEAGRLAGFSQDLEEGVEQDSSHLVGEFWAIAVEGYLMDRAGFKDSHSTRAWILEHEPKLYDLITRYFPTEPWEFCTDLD
jgi:hypothetical protein